MYYFGYGSNMLTARLKARVPSATPVATATLDGYELRFHKRSRDGSGKCNVSPSSHNDASVHGVIFEVNDSELDALDEAEKRGRGYVRQDVSVRTAASTVDAFAYVAQPAYIDQALLPYEWYHAIVVAGAREHALPSSYISQLGAVQTYPDPNQERRQKYRTLLHEAGYPLSKD